MFAKEILQMYWALSQDYTAYLIIKDNTTGEVHGGVVHNAPGHQAAALFMGSNQPLPADIWGAPGQIGFK